MLSALTYRKKLAEGTSTSDVSCLPLTRFFRYSSFDCMVEVWNALTADALLFFTGSLAVAGLHGDAGLVVFVNLYEACWEKFLLLLAVVSRDSGAF